MMKNPAASRLNCVSFTLCLCVALAGCSGKKKSDQSPPEQRMDQAPDQVLAPASKPGTPWQGPSPAKVRADEQAKKRAAVEQAARSALATWLKAQNGGDTATYHRLYHPRHFQGVRRTHDGKAKRFDAAGWRADREKMFKLGKLEVAADEVTVATWLDADSKLKPGVVITRFVQRWRGGTYADHGVRCCTGGATATAACGSSTKIC